MPLANANVLAFQNLSHSGFAIGNVNGSQHHIGVLFLTDQSLVRFCHLAWHNSLRFSEPKPEYLWSNFDVVDEENRRFIAAFIQNLEEEGPDVPYGFGIDGECFDPDGRFIPPPIGQGLTCATFVVEALRHQGFELLNDATWPSRQDDDAWQQWAVSQLLATNASAEHVQALQERPHSARIRPDEVAACSLTIPLPNDYQAIVELAAEIYAVVNSQPTLQ